LQSSDANKVNLPCRLFLDFKSNAKWLAIYIPVDFNSYRWIAAIADLYPQIINALDKGLEISAKMPGDTSATFSRSMNFSNRIYMYREVDLDLEQLASLDTIYKQHAISLQIRGQDYRTLHWNEKPGTALQPAAPTAASRTAAADSAWDW
jgi:hypothetical protein